MSQIAYYAAKKCQESLYAPRKEGENPRQTLADIIDQAADEKYAEVVRQAQAVIDHKAYTEAPSARDRLREALHQVKEGK